MRAASATLGGAIDPRGAATTYFFQYGPTVAYGAQSTPATLPAGVKQVKVGQAVNGFRVGYHYRLVARNQFGAKNGRDRTFSPKSTGRVKFKFPKSTVPTVFGGPFILSGTIAGAGSANRHLALQASPFPYLTAFVAIGVPVVTNAAGAFSFAVPSLSTSTQFRVNTLDPKPIYSQVLTQHVAPRVTLKVRTTRQKGLVRLYGTVTPSEVGARVLFQLQKAVRPGTKSEKAEERTTKFVTRDRSLVKRGTRTISRFSIVVTVRTGGRYRAYVIPRHSGPLVAGASPSRLLHAAPASTIKTQRKIQQEQKKEQQKKEQKKH